MNNMHHVEGRNINEKEQIVVLEIKLKQGKQHSNMLTSKKKKKDLHAKKKKLKKKCI